MKSFRKNFHREFAAFDMIFEECKEQKESLVFVLKKFQNILVWTSEANTS